MADTARFDSINQQRILMKNYRGKMLGCWLGKSVGGVLGTPFEGRPAVNDIHYYDPLPEKSLPNDDVELQVMYACALSKMETPVVNRETLADIWLKHMDFNVDEYAVALYNLRRGIRPPYSGSYDNYYIDGMGAAIRSELWACLAPGNPDLAIKYAYEDACVDHADDGIYAEVLFAAMESLAFVEPDIDRLMEYGLSCIPSESGIHRSVVDTVAWWNESHDWLKVRNLLFEKYATEFACCVLPNIPFTVLALLAGGGDFGKTICTAVNCGMDTDCSAATAGAILGTISPESITEKWLKPIGHELVVRDTAIVNLETPKTIDLLIDLITELKGRLGSFAPSVENSEPDWRKFEIDAEICALDNLYWWFIPLRAFKANGSLFACKGSRANLTWLPIKEPSNYC